MTLKIFSIWISKFKFPWKLNGQSCSKQYRWNHVITLTYKNNSFLLSFFLLECSTDIPLETITSKTFKNIAVKNIKYAHLKKSKPWIFNNLRHIHNVISSSFYSICLKYCKTIQIGKYMYLKLPQSIKNIGKYPLIFSTIYILYPKRESKCVPQIIIHQKSWCDIRELLLVEQQLWS